MSGLLHDDGAGPVDGAEIVNVGEDTWVRKTRQMILEREGFVVVSVSPEDAFTVDYARTRMVVLCHTLPAAVRESLMDFVAAHAPQARILLLEKSFERLAISSPGVLTALPDPRGIVLAARAVLR